LVPVAGDFFDLAVVRQQAIIEILSTWRRLPSTPRLADPTAIG
jgi:hypothetical protein